MTGQLPSDIRIIITHLFMAYGKINELELQTKYEDTIKMGYNTTDPMDDIYNVVEDLVELVALVECPYTPQQQVNVGYLIISKQRKLIIHLLNYWDGPKVCLDRNCPKTVVF